MEDNNEKGGCLSTIFWGSGAVAFISLIGSQMTDDIGQAHDRMSMAGVFGLIFLGLILLVFILSNLGGKK